MKKIGKIFLIIIILILILFLTRLLTPKEIDDISPEIPCEQKLIEKSEVLWVIPFFNNKSISENSEWCDYILSLNKKLGLHGVYHTYREFQTTKNQEHLEKGIQEFEKCFKAKPEMFKPPQLKINKENKKLIKDNNLKLKVVLNQFTHKVYHCNNTGILSNKFIDVF